MGTPVAEPLPACSWCRLRKKKCSRTLPRCSYCFDRRLACDYSDRTPHIAFQSSESKSAYEHHGWSEKPSPGFQQQQSIIEQVHKIIAQLHASNASVSSDMTLPYWHGLHKWLPVLSPESFNDRAKEPMTSETPGFSILRLSLILLARSPHEPDGIMTQESLYVAVKMLSAQLSAYDIVSVDAVQTNVLVAMYEYATQRCEAALATISTGIRAAYALGLDGERIADQLSKPRQQEMNRLWWSLAICERLFVLETRNWQQPLLSRPPTTHPWQHKNEDDSLEILGAQEMSDLGDHCVNRGFTRAVEATALMDAVLCLARHTDPNISFADDYARVDRSLQSFLSTLLQECCGTWAIYCGAIAIVIRTMMILHGAFLHSSFDEESSNAAMESCIRIMVDISDSHKHFLCDKDIATLPPTCAYILQEALKFCDRKVKTCGTTNDDARKSLRRFWNAFQLRWTPAQ